MSKGGGKAAKKAAAAQTEAQQRAIDEMKRQFGITQENIDPFIQAGTAALPQFAANTTVGGLDQQLGQIFGSENFQNLRDERTTALQGQLGAAGLTRSGTALQEAANVPTQLGFDIENLLSGRTSALTGLGQESALGLGGLGQQNSGAIAGLLQGQGQSQAQGILGAQQAKAGGFGNLLGLGSFLGGTDFGQEVGGKINTGLSNLFFSDPRLKTNVREISKIKDL